MADRSYAGCLSHRVRAECECALTVFLSDQAHPDRAYATDDQVNVFARNLVQYGADATLARERGFSAASAIERVMCSSELWEMPRLQGKLGPTWSSANTSPTAKRS